MNMKSKINHLVRVSAIFCGIIFLILKYFKCPNTLLGNWELLTQAAGYSVILISVYDKWLWRINPFIKIPILKKEYNALIKYKYNETQGEKNIDVEIFQTLTNINVSINTDEITSNSIMSELIEENNTETLDLLLVIHAEHGGGNNSAFATHVVSSSGTDTYSAIAAAIGSLKGPKHGGANKMIVEMAEDIKAHVADWTDPAQVKAYLYKIAKKEAFDKTGLIYGMGHAIYTLSDPRAMLLKEKARELATEKNMLQEFGLYCHIEDLSKEIFRELRGEDFIICANVDLYSGFVYQMLGIPEDLYTPLFAAARIAGWAAHRIEQIASDQKIMRPAYNSIIDEVPYESIGQRSPL